MEKIIKYSNCFGFVLALCAMVISGCSCSTTKPDPLAGWQKAYGEEPNKIIENDYQDYIQKLPPVGPKSYYVGTVFFYKDGTGQHAVTFEYDKPNKDVWDCYLFYDKNNKRIGAEKYYKGSYWNP